MKEHKSRLVFCMGIVFLFAVLLVPWAQRVAHAAEFELKFGSIGPETIFMSKVQKVWMAKVEKETNGRVHFTAYWGGTLLTPADAPTEVEKGIVDVGAYSSDYPKVGFEITKLSSTFWSGFSVAAQDRLIVELHKKFPPLAAEYSRWGKLLGHAALSPMQIMTKKPVRSLSDLKGMKIKTTVAYIPLLQELGAEAVTMSMFDCYLALQKGTIDGILAAWDVMIPLKFFEVVKFVTLTNLTYPPQMGVSMSAKTWNKLPPDIQKVFENNMKFYSEENLKLMAESDNENIAAAKKQNIETITLSKDDQKKIEDINYKESLKKAAELDGKGLPGTALLKEIRRVRDAGGAR